MGFTYRNSYKIILSNLRTGDPVGYADRIALYDISTRIFVGNPVHKSCRIYVHEFLQDLL